MKNKPITIANMLVNPGEKKLLELPAASLYTQTPINVPVHIIHGNYHGPRLFLTGAIHGDEINGVEIIRRLLRHRSLHQLHGSIIAVPVANVHGFITLSRYLPDRRDLNRSFPGSKEGSLTSRLAHLFMEEIISKCTHGIDLHTGNIHSENLPHVRTNIEAPGTIELAKAFKTPVILDAKLRDGSLRQAATEANIPVIIYEGGEALRFNELAIRIGVRGILNVLNHLGMIKTAKIAKTSRMKKIKPRVAKSSTWVRSPKSGIFFQSRVLGTYIDEGEKIGYISDPFTKKEGEIFSTSSGIIIGRNTLPLVNEGDALFHVARIKGGEDVTSQIDVLHNYFTDNFLDD